MKHQNSAPQSRVRQVVATIALLAGLFLLNGCQSAKPNPLANLKRFQEADQATAVFKYDSWDYIFMLQPPVMEGGYRRILKVEDLRPVILSHGVSRDLAVVLLGWQYTPADHYRLGQRWNEVLKAEGFQRVVCVKTVNEKKINGSPIVYDSALAPVRLAGLGDGP
jgi:hypothetical protein